MDHRRVRRSWNSGDHRRFWPSLAPGANGKFTDLRLPLCGRRSTGAVADLEMKKSGSRVITGHLANGEPKARSQPLKGAPGYLDDLLARLASDEVQLLPGQPWSKECKVSFRARREAETLHHLSLLPQIRERSSRVRTEEEFADLILILACLVRNTKSRKATAFLNVLLQKAPTTPSAV